MLKNNIHISVIIPIYGTEKFIEKCLVSLFEQSKTDCVQYILVNDCTKDRARDIACEVIARYPGLNTILIDHQVNKGLAATRQTGIDHASGEYSIHIDSDDWCEKDMLEEMYNTIIKKDYDIVVADMIWDYKDKSVYKKSNLPTDQVKRLKRLLDGRFHASLSNKLVKHSLYKRHNIRNIQGLNYSEDLIATIKLFSNTSNVGEIKKAYLHYVQHEGSMMHKLNVETYVSFSNAIKEIDSYLKNKFNDSLETDLTRKKIELKFNGLKNNIDGDTEKIATLFPEITSRIFSSNLNFQYKVALFLASKGYIKTFNQIIRIMSFLKLLANKRKYVSRLQ